MKTFLLFRNSASKGAALIIVLALVVLATGLSLAYLSRTTTNRQLAQSSYHDTSADLLARTALDITVSDLKQVIGRYAFAVYDEGGLANVNLGGVPTYANLTLPTRPSRRAPAIGRIAPRHHSEESEIMLAAFTPDDPCQAPSFTPDHINVTLATGVACSLLFNTNQHPDSFAISWLPGGLSFDTRNGQITGIPNDPLPTTDIT